MQVRETHPATSATLVASGCVWHHASVVRIRDFLSLVYDRLPPHLPEALRDHRWRVRFSMLQVYFAGPAVHYEVWVQRKYRRIEIGLHFEGEREENERWARALGERVLENQARLGPDVELEEWTASWMRLHETRPLAGELKEPLADEIAERLAAFISVLEPMLEKERAAMVG
ncbi:MAG: hypothetical protein HY723_00505 [Chloroflexi bacterium]|nr:hypothetical protein [Chloroflexota bacterium]